MPAKSKAQQRFMGLVHALNKGDVDPSKVSKKVKDVAKDMDKSDVKKYASTKHKGKPEKVKQEDINLETLIKENPAAIAAAVQTMQKMKAKNPKTGRVNKLSTALGDKQHPAHKKAKSVFQRIVDKFKKKKDGPNPTSKDSPLVPKKQSKSDADFYKRQFTGEVQEGPDDVRFARRALSKIAKHEASLRKAMFELEQAFLRDPRPENQKLAKEIKKNYKNGVTGFMKDSVQMIKRMK